MLAEVLLRYVLKVAKNNMVLEYVDSGMVAIMLAFVIRTFGVQAFKIPSASMENTLLIGDHLLVNKFIYGTRIPGTGKAFLALRDPQRGDVIVFQYPEDPSRDFIKRCIGLPGDVIEVKAKQVYVNGRLQDEPDVLHRDLAVLPPESGNPRDFYGPVTVPADAFFMMGDNRDFSKDSRFWGFLPRKLIKGKAWVVYWPFDRWRVVR
ncbi:MAG: signal peptidase I [Candidatus Firestonebacteria bacterium]|nr:signal peptidase I [Candidatus Firestonebacteria bacterium]